MPVLLTLHELIEGIFDAHELAYSEAANCPWCSGQISFSKEEHHFDENFTCLWVRVMDFVTFGEIDFRDRMISKYPRIFDRVAITTDGRAISYPIDDCKVVPL